MPERYERPSSPADDPVVLRPDAQDGVLAGLIDRRRSTREFARVALDLDDLASLLSSAYGRRSDGRRSVPSAHALYPLAVTVVAGDLGSLPPAVYRYDADSHQLLRAVTGDYRQRVAGASLADSDWLPAASVLILLSADIDRVNAHFAEQPPLGRRGERYVWLEAGHVSQTLYLAAAERGMGAVLVAGFDDERLGGLLTEIGCGGASDQPLAIVAIGTGEIQRADASGVATVVSMEDRSATWSREARDLARIGAELAEVELPAIEVRLSRAGAEAALAAWHRDDEVPDAGTTRETAEHRVVRVRAGWLALIGAAVEERGVWSADDVAVRLGADVVSAAVDASEDGLPAI